MKPSGCSQVSIITRYLISIQYTVYIVYKSRILCGENEKNHESLVMTAVQLLEFSTRTFGQARTIDKPTTSATVGHVPPSPISLQTNSPGHHKCPLPQHNQKYFHATAASIGAKTYLQATELLKYYNHTRRGKVCILLKPTLQ